MAQQNHMGKDPEAETPVPKIQDAQETIPSSLGAALSPHVWRFSKLCEQRSPHFHFALSPATLGAGLSWQEREGASFAPSRLASKPSLLISAAHKDLCKMDGS